MRRIRSLALLLASLALGLGAVTSTDRATAQASKPMPGWLGIEMESAPGGKGVSVRHVVNGSPARGAGVADGDRILAVDGTTVASPADVSGAVAAKGAGKVVALTISRGKDVVVVRVALVARPSRDQIFRMESVGQKLTAFGPLKLAAGPGPVDAAKLAGKVVVVDFFATWCGPCLQVGPYYEALFKKYGPQGLNIIAISAETAPVLAAWSAKNNVPYTIASDPADTLALKLGAPALPSSLVIDKHGVVRDVTVGFDLIQVQRTEQLVSALLKEP